MQNMHDIIPPAIVIYMCTEVTVVPTLQAQLATGMMLLGAVVPDSARQLSKVAPSAVFDSVLKVRYLESSFQGAAVSTVCSSRPSNWSLQGRQFAVLQGSPHQLVMVASRMFCMFEWEVQS